jgi:hypothetical protein
MARHDDEYEDDVVDEPPRRRKEMGWLDKQFNNTPLVLLILFPVCCGIVALVFAIIGVAACEDPKARRNATIVLVISVVWIGVAVVLGVVRQLATQGH